jgi:hypothetical protein
MRLSPHCHHYVCCSDGHVLVVGWNVFVLIHRGDNLKVIIVKLNKEQKKNIPEVKTHMHLDPCCCRCVYCSAELVLVAGETKSCANVGKLTFTHDLQKRKEQKKTYLRSRRICVSASAVVVVYVVVMDLFWWQVRRVCFNMLRWSVVI